MFPNNHGKRDMVPKPEFNSYISDNQEEYALRFHKHMMH